MKNPLPPRQAQVLTLLAQGQSNREIAKVLGCSERTVSNQCNLLYLRLGVRNRIQAAMWWKENQADQPEDERVA